MQIARRPVRIRRILTGTGTAQTAARVQCPLSEGLVATAQCTTCPRHQQALESREPPLLIACSEREQAAAPETLLSRQHLDALLGATLITELMTHDVTCVTSDVSLESLTILFEERKISCAPVVELSGMLTGLVTKTDVVVDFFDFDQPAPVEVADVMIRRPTTVFETTTLAQAVPLLLRAPHLPVVNSAGEVIGIVSARDVIGWLAEITAQIDG